MNNEKDDSEFKELGPNVYGENGVPDRTSAFELSQAHPMLSVQDVDASIEYYRKALGFVVEWAHRGENGSTTIANLWRGSLSIFLVGDDCFGPSCIYCHIESRQVLESLYADLVAGKARIVNTPTDQPWGNYDMRVADLDENEFVFASPATDD